jgi:hypothetical protein
MADVKPEEQFAQAQQGGRQAPAADAGDARAQQPARAARAKTGPQPEPQPEPEAGGQQAGEEPPRVPEGVAWLIADEPLFVGDPEAAAAPARAFNAGDSVPAEMVDRFGWHGQTHVPEWASAPPAPAPDQTGSEEHK